MPEACVDMLSALQDVSSSITERERNDVFLVAVTGVDGVGKTVFCDALSNVLEATGVSVVRATLDNFHNPRSVRHKKGRYSASGFYEDSFDIPAFEEFVLKPAKYQLCKQVQLQRFDLAADNQVEDSSRILPKNCVLLVDGIFLLKPSLENYWDLSVYLDAPFSITFARLTDREGFPASEIDSLRKRYVGGQQLHIQQDTPMARADFIIEMSDFNRPIIKKMPLRG